jgi:probable rRNA maturation factor
MALAHHAHVFARVQALVLKRHHFTGLGAPYWQPDARGAIVGLSRGSSVAHIARAALESIAYEAARLALENAAEDDSPLSNLATLEIAIVDDITSDQVHRDFMDIEGPTDVITFHHGEIVIGAEVAERQAAEYDEPLAREILRYMIHGLLHLAGHEDGQSDERAVMEAAQETIVAQLWTAELQERLNPEFLK